MAKKLYIGNLSYEVTEDDLSQLFGQCGQVSSATVITDRATGRSKGFGFVEMPNDDEVKHAIDRMNGYDLKGRQITVDEAREKPEGGVTTGGRGYDRDGEFKRGGGGRGGKGTRGGY